MQLLRRTMRPGRLALFFWLCFATGFILFFVSPKYGNIGQSFWAPPRPGRWPGNERSDCPPHSDLTYSGSGPGSTSATYLSPNDLLCRPAASNLSAVPKLLHQTWKTTELPAKFDRWSKSCRQKHPDWEWVLWTDDDNDELVKRYFPWMEETYRELPGNIYRADLVRNMYMYMFGGVYLDLDTECLNHVSKALDGFGVPVAPTSNITQDLEDPFTQVALFGRMGKDDSFRHSIPNAWMAASPGHPFFLMPLISARNEIAKSKSFMHDWWYDYPSAEQMTGPVALRNSIERYNGYGASSEALRLAAAGPFGPEISANTTHDLVLLPKHAVYPFNWNTNEKIRSTCSAEQESFDPEHCKELLHVEEKGSISITYWSHSHRGKGSDEKNIELISQE